MNKEKQFYFSPKRELVEFTLLNETETMDDAPQPVSTVMRPVHLAPNSSQVAHYVFTPYDDHWNPYSCLGELDLTLFVRTNGAWIRKDNAVYKNTRANWESMSGFAIVSYLDGESSVRKLSGEHK